MRFGLSARRLLVIAGATVVAGCGSSRHSATTGDASVDATAGHVVRGTIVDLDGAAVTNIYVTVSTDFCIPDRTTKTGAFAVQNVRPGGAKRLIVYGPTASDGPYASLAFAFPGAESADVDFAKPIVIPRLVTPLPYDPSAAALQRLATSDGFAITFSATDLHVEGFGDPKLFAIRVPIDKAPPFGDVLARLHVLYVVEPLQSKLARPAKIEMPNPKGLAVGVRVDFYQLDYLEGALVPAARGYVRDDGIVVSDDGSGVTELTWLGFAPSGA